MRVLINTIAHVGGGGITYLENMLPRFADDEHEYIVLVPASRNVLEEPAESSVQFETVSPRFDTLPARLFYEQFVLPIRLRQWDVDVLFSPADLTPLLTPRPTLLAVRNLNPYVSPSEIGLDRPLTRRLKFFVQRQLTKLSVRKAEHVYFVSNYSREVSNQYLGLPDYKTSVVYHGIERSSFEHPAPPDDEKLRSIVEAKAPYLLVVSTVFEHKNYEVLLEAYGGLSAEKRAEYPLLIAGRTPSDSYMETLGRIIADYGLEDDVIFLGGVDYGDIPFLYSEARLYVLPSKLETFGHTLVEAMTSGVPVVAADSTCLPEITDGAAELFDPDDDSELAATIEELLEDDTRREALVEAGYDRAADFSWEKTFEETKQLLERVATEE